MRKGLFSKMVAIYTIIITVSFIIMATILSIWFQGYYQNQREKQLIDAARLLGGIAVNHVQDSNYEIPTENLQVLGSYFHSDILMLDRNAFVYAVSNEKYDSIKWKQVFTKNLEDLRLNKIVKIEGSYDKLFGKNAQIYVIPVDYKDNFYGAIAMITPLNEFKDPLRSVYQRIWISAIFAIIVSSIIMYHFSERIIIKPLASINQVAKRIAKGEVEKRVHIDSDDEIGELAESFNSMADSLEKVDKNRRDFISNVSHEIRSPITSIKGFIGGILDGVIPKEKERYYLSITYEEIQRLTRLVNDLLDLSAIEAGRFSLKIDEFDINEIIRLTVIKFETKIREKKLKVDVCFSEDHVYVAADRDRIIQVVTNLVDNAIKYVNDAGNIQIMSKTKGDKVFISVYNDGPGIAKEDLLHIWDRFYKADKSRTRKMSTGLGLPIARNILTQLGEDIWVENKDGSGVTFTFTLKRVR